MSIEMHKLIGEATVYDKKQMLEVKRPKSWLFVKDDSEVVVKEFVKEPFLFAKEFVKASRQIYKLISQNPQINAVQMGESIGLSTRQVQKYLKRLQELGKITRVGGRKMGE